MDVNLDIKDVFSFKFPVQYQGKIKPSEKTTLQSRRLQDRSKYFGDGSLKPEEVEVKEEEVVADE